MHNRPTLGTRTTEGFRRVREVFESALQHPPDLRTRFVEQACAGDIGFQQISQLIHVSGIEYLGPLPAAA